MHNRSPRRCCGAVFHHASRLEPVHRPRRRREGAGTDTTVVVRAMVAAPAGSAVGIWSVQHSGCLSRRSACDRGGAIPGWARQYVWGRNPAPTWVDWHRAGPAGRAGPATVAGAVAAAGAADEPAAAAADEPAAGAAAATTAGADADAATGADAATTAGAHAEPATGADAAATTAAGAHAEPAPGAHARRAEHRLMREPQCSSEMSHGPLSSLSSPCACASTRETRLPNRPEVPLAGVLRRNPEALLADTRLLRCHIGRKRDRAQPPILSSRQALFTAQARTSMSTSAPISPRR